MIDLSSIREEYSRKGDSNAMRRLSSALFSFLILLNTFGYFHVLLVVEHHYYRRAAREILERENEIGGNLLLRVPISSYPQFCRGSELIFEDNTALADSRYLCPDDQRKQFQNVTASEALTL